MQRNVLLHPLLFARDLGAQLRFMAHDPHLRPMTASRKVGTTAREKRCADAVVQVQPGNPTATDAIEHRHQDLAMQHQGRGQRLVLGPGRPDKVVGQGGMAGVLGHVAEDTPRRLMDWD